MDLTDNEIIKALECCCIAKLKADCKKLECPFYNDEIGNCNYIDDEEAIYKATLDLINRQQAEIKTLQERNVVLRGMIDTQKAEIERLQESIELMKGAKCVYSYDGETLEYCTASPCPIYKTTEQIKSEAIKEFAERLKESKFDVDVSFGYGREVYTEAVAVVEIDNLVKEMVGDNNETN